MACIGIDLGTTHSLITVFQNDSPQLIANVHGKYLTPSVVGVDDNGEMLVGAVARERLISHPQLTVHAFKRNMGTEKVCQLGPHKFRPEELSALILKSLKADAEAHLDTEVTEAVISVPAYFNDTQRNATIQAAEIAGIQVQRLINEPTAAALVYGLADQSDDQKYLVLDLGGGTFDVTILEYFDGVFEVHASAGNNHLGGEDFTEVVMEWLTELFKQHKKTVPPKSQCYQLAETVKRQLSDQESYELALGDEQITLSQQEFERRCQPLLNLLREPIVRAMQDASLRPENFDEVVLIGGATRMTLFRQFITKLFKRFPRQSENPDHVVALGAAIQAGLVQKSEALQELVLTDVMPYSLGVAIHNETEPDNPLFSPIIERNQTVPVSRVETYFPVHEDQKEVHLQVFQGESRYVRNNVKLGEVDVKFGAGEEGKNMDVRFTYDVNGLLEVLVKSVGQEAKRLVIEQRPGIMSQDQVNDALNNLAQLKVHPRDKEINRALLARAERLYEVSLDDKRTYVGNLIDGFNSALASQDEKIISRARKELEKLLEQLEDRSWF